MIDIINRFKEEIFYPKTYIVNYVSIYLKYNQVEGTHDTYLPLNIENIVNVDWKSLVTLTFHVSGLG